MHVEHLPGNALRIAARDQHAVGVEDGLECLTGLPRDDVVVGGVDGRRRDRRQRLREPRACLGRAPGVALGREQLVALGDVDDRGTDPEDRAMRVVAYGVVVHEPVAGPIGIGGRRACDLGLEDRLTAEDAPEQ